MQRRSARVGSTHRMPKSASISCCMRRPARRRRPWLSGSMRRQPDAAAGMARCAIPAYFPEGDTSMPDGALTIPADLRHDLAIAAVQGTIVDVPTVRRHKLSQTSVTAQSYVIVEIRLANGVTGIGEAATLGGPRWSEESVEAIKANIDHYLAPALDGLAADRFALAGMRMDAAAKRNTAAKAAIETALFDAAGKTLGVPAALLLGGVVRDRIPVLWTLASGDAAQEIDEAEQKLDARLHDTFK